MKNNRKQALRRGLFLGMRLVGGMASVVLLLSACTAPGEAPGGNPPADVFRPPTAVPTLAPTITLTPILPTDTPPPTLAPDCLNRLTYLDDLTIPDGTSVRAGALLDKRWKVRNSGTCNWDGRYRLKRVNGPELGGPLEATLYPARGGAEVVLRLELVAPAEAGSYRSAWQAVDPQGQSFGDPFYIEIQVAP